MDEQTESLLISSIKDLQKQVHFLERKIDTLIQKSGDRSGGNRSYSKGASSSTYTGKFGGHGSRTKGARSGNTHSARHSGNKMGQAYPKKNLEFDPDSCKNTAKPRKRKTTSSARKRK